MLLHGLAVSHRYLMPTAEALGGGVHVPDLPGFGRSRGPRRAFGAGEHAEVIAAWMDAEGLRGARVLGGSFGCQVGVELAIRRPDLVSALVLLGPMADPAAATMIGQAWRLVRDFRHEDLRQLPIVLSGSLAAGPVRIAGTLRRSVRYRIERRLPLITVPVLVLRGENDTIAPEPWASLVARLTSARMVTIPGAAHNAVTTAGPLVAAAATSFVEELAPSADVDPAQRP
ncbi:alpha/beta fold hydrolase [Catenuloplanes japonicus]|uniref:alpha/beta fold hydrolase n=1 Tax=Catenuloplanes japonicus TaxID=33876 RepID=UPI0012FC23E5|nr:alpha/beta fold hydrolase [Catenuloplanes japonicus]